MFTLTTRVASNPVYHQRSEHIDVNFHWIRDKVQYKTVHKPYVTTAKQRADMLTKVIDGALFHKHVS